MQTIGSAILSTASRFLLMKNGTGLERFVPVNNPKAV